MARRPRSDKPTPSSMSQARSERSDNHGKLLAEVRRIIAATVPDAVEERKWKKPSNPAGVPVWSRNGIICVADELKGRLRLTFPKGASLDDPKGLFNTRLDSKTVRAIDISIGSPINERALKELIRGAATLNSSRTD